MEKTELIDLNLETWKILHEALLELKKHDLDKSNELINKYILINK